MQAIGQRVIELKGHSDKNIFKDSVIVEATAEIEKLDKNIDELKQKAAEISRVTG
jgi:4-hydroxy-3-methylbut-2-en-1-yl diphosphate synthase IspG/GcpE